MRTLSLVKEEPVSNDRFFIEEFGEIKIKIVPCKRYKDGVDVLFLHKKKVPDFIRMITDQEFIEDALIVKCVYLKWYEKPFTTMQKKTKKVIEEQKSFLFKIRKDYEEKIALSEKIAKEVL